MHQTDSKCHDRKVSRAARYASTALGRGACFSVLGVRVDAVQIPEVVRQMEHWISQRDRAHLIAVTTMHGVTETLHDPLFLEVLQSADLVVPDGMPLVWLGRLRGFGLKRRVYGPELMETFCRDTAGKYKHFFYGGDPGVPQQLAGILRERYGVQVAGTYSSPFRPLTNQEEEQVAQLIGAAAPDVLWVGLGAPKQDRWIFEHRDRLRVPVMLGVGAAFNFVTGRLR